MENGDNNVDQVEVDVYDNDYYTRESDYDLLAPMMDILVGKDESEHWDVEMHKAIL